MTSTSGEGGGGPAEFSGEQRAALDARQVDQDRTLSAVHRLEAAMAAAAPGREGAWRDEVVSSLRALADATAEEERNAAEPDSSCPISLGPSPAYATAFGDSEPSTARCATASRRSKQTLATPTPTWPTCGSGSSGCSVRCGTNGRASPT
jgi:hypothetical protein